MGLPVVHADVATIDNIVDRVDCSAFEPQAIAVQPDDSDDDGWMTDEDGDEEDKDKSNGDQEDGDESEVDEKEEGRRSRTLG